MSVIGWATCSIVHRGTVHSIVRVVVGQDYLSDPIGIWGNLLAPSHHSVSILRCKDWRETSLSEVIVLGLAHVAVSGFLHIVKHGIALCENELSIYHLLVLIREAELTVEEIIRCISRLSLLSCRCVNLNVLVIEKVKFRLLQVLIIGFRAPRLPQPGV